MSEDNLDDLKVLSKEDAPLKTYAPKHISPADGDGGVWKGDPLYKSSAPAKRFKSKKKSDKSTVRNVLEWALTIVCAIILALLIRNYTIEPFEIPTESMVSTIQAGDRVFGEKISYLFREPQKGDVITFIDPEDKNTILIKRLIATPGDTINFKDGKLLINDEVQNEPYVGDKQSMPLDRFSSVIKRAITYPYTLEDDEYWVMGDNRTNSLDSRYFGPISKKSITSRAWLIYWPFENVGFF